MKLNEQFIIKKKKTVSSSKIKDIFKFNIGENNIKSKNNMIINILI